MHEADGSHRPDMSDFSPEQPARRSRPTCLAPPPLTQPQAGFEGLDILREVDGPAGILLFGALRDVMLRVETAASDWAAVFGVDTTAHRAAMVRTGELPRALHSALVAVAAKVGQPEPSANERLARACQEIASWAELHGACGTRLAFVQASALLLPQDAKVALSVARLARDLRETARAESWFRHAVRLARHRDRESYGWAYIGLGVLFLRAGNLPAANAAMGRALRHAKRSRLREIAAAAHHHMFHLATEAERIRDAYTHARTALDLYGTSKPRLRDLACDVGRFWIHLEQFRRAVPVLEAAVEGDPDHNHRAMMHALLAYAAAAAGKIATFEAARDAAVEGFRTGRGKVWLTETKLFLSYAYHAAGDWDLAEEAACKAYELAVANGEAEFQFLADAALDQARSRTNSSVRSPTRSENSELMLQADRLARQLVDALASVPI